MPGTPLRTTRHTTTSIGKTRAQLRAGGGRLLALPLTSDSASLARPKTSPLSKAQTTATKTPEAPALCGDEAPPQAPMPSVKLKLRGAAGSPEDLLASELEECGVLEDEEEESRMDTDGALPSTTDGPDSQTDSELGFPDTSSEMGDSTLGKTTSSARKTCVVCRFRRLIDADTDGRCRTCAGTRAPSRSSPPTYSITPTLLSPETADAENKKAKCVECGMRRVLDPVTDTCGECQFDDFENFSVEPLQLMGPLAPCPTEGAEFARPTEKKKKSASTVSKDAARRTCAAKELLGLQGSLRDSGWIKAKCSSCFMRRLLDPNTDQCTECVGVPTNGRPPAVSKPARPLPVAESAFTLAKSAPAPPTRPAPRLRPEGGEALCPPGQLSVDALPSPFAAPLDDPPLELDSPSLCAQLEPFPSLSPSLAPSPSLLAAPPCMLKFGEGSFGGFSLTFSPACTSTSLVVSDPMAETDVLALLDTHDEDKEEGSPSEGLPVLPVSVLESVTLEEMLGGGERLLEQCCRDNPVFDEHVALFEEYL